MITAVDSARYPIGSFSYDDPIELSPAHRRERIAQVAELPSRLDDALAGLAAAGLEYRYRTDGWRIRDVVHHLADSHMNGFVRFKLAMTESTPVVKAYDETSWATVADTGAPIGHSRHIIAGLHARWVTLLESLDDAAWSRAFYHPGAGVLVTLDRALAMYAWHGRHHVAHIAGARVQGIVHD